VSKAHKKVHQVDDLKQHKLFKTKRELRIARCLIEDSVNQRWYDHQHMMQRALRNSDFKISIAKMLNLIRQTHESVMRCLSGSTLSRRISLQLRDDVEARERGLRPEPL
jgi:hypothetical protein